MNCCIVALVLARLASGSMLYQQLARDNNLLPADDLTLKGVVVVVVTVVVVIVVAVKLGAGTGGVV
jgi:hypothetical protein